MILTEVINYLDSLSKISDYKLVLAKNGGYFTFQNSGRRDSVKSFTFGIETFISMLKDIRQNFNAFKSHEVYNEEEWRQLGTQYFSDNAAKSMITVQTRSQIASLNKLIAWANNISPSQYDEKKIYLNLSYIDNSIHQLEQLQNIFTPEIIGDNENLPSVNEETILQIKDLNNFAFEAFKYLVKEYGENVVLKDKQETPATINEQEYTALKLKPFFKNGNIIGVFNNTQTRDQLTSGTNRRYYEENLNLSDYAFSYFTTQWGASEDGDRTFQNFAGFVAEITNGMLKTTKNDNVYSLIKLNEVGYEPIQKIFYGAPGTGKSHKIEKILKHVPEDQKIRITFFPDFDYNSFVGGYKPVSEKNPLSGDSEIKYKFVPQVLTEIYVRAWKNPSKKYYLIIEEINRGNCAEIFGDFFQLLDRTSNYSLNPSQELSQYLTDVLTDKGEKGYKDGKIRMPSNLNMLASMNTSDQSLFPMDSAFKRRWSWEYVPINYNELNDDATATKSASRNESYNYQVRLDESHYFRWIDFIKQVNWHIKVNPNLGPDKCIGNYFIKANNGEISLEEFVNKVVFYLWIDVFKDEEGSIFDKLESAITYEDFFPISSTGKKNLELLLKYFEIEVLTDANSLTQDGQVESIEEAT